MKFYLIFLPIFFAGCNLLEPWFGNGLDGDSFTKKNSDNLDALVFYNLNETSGNSFSDVKNNANLSFNSANISTVTGTGPNGTLGSAFNCSGIGGAPYAANASLTTQLNGTNELALSFWVFPTGIGGGDALLELYTDGNNRLRLNINASGHLEILYNDPTAYLHTFTTGMTNNNWYHIVININSDLSSATVYMNNSFVSTQTNTGVNISFNTFYVCNDAGLGAAGVLIGRMDAVGIWERQLTSTEITELYNGTSPYYSN